MRRPSSGFPAHLSQRQLVSGASLPHTATYSLNLHLGLGGRELGVHVLVDQVPRGGRAIEGREDRHGDLRANAVLRFDR